MTPKAITSNTLYYGDNLPVLRECIADESVDLIYLDPPFHAGASRSTAALLQDESGIESGGQTIGFEDAWRWNPAAEATYQELIARAPGQIGAMIGALRQLIGTNQMMAYLVMMAARLVELHRVLKPTGSLYLHCDPTASQYLKIVLDAVFGPEHYRNEIVWKSTSSHNDAKRKFADVSDVIYLYTKGDDYPFNVQYVPYSQDYLASYYRFVDEQGRRYRLSDLRSPNPRPNLVYDYKGFKPHPNGWAVSRERMEQLDAEGRLYFPKKPEGRVLLKRFLDAMPGMPVSNVWDDIQPVQSQAAERLGTPTQKPLALLERIVNASSNAGDIVLDPFCGCGTAIAAAQKLGRRWIGIDITHPAIALIKYRLSDMFPGTAFDVVGEPQDIASAGHLAQVDTAQFKWWALSLIKARPSGSWEGSKRATKGDSLYIDGVIAFLDDNTDIAKRALVHVSPGLVELSGVRDLREAVERDGAAIGIVITLEDPTADMIAEATAAGVYHSQGWGRDYSRIQFLSVQQLLSGVEVKMPPTQVTFKQMPKVEHDDELTQTDLLPATE